MNDTPALDSIMATFKGRFLIATIVWVVFWPALWFIRLGDITGPKAWFWIIGELNYPIVAIAYWLIDDRLVRAGLKPWWVLAVGMLLIAAVMPFYYHRYGFALGVSLEARLF